MQAERERHQGNTSSPSLNSYFERAGQLNQINAPSNGDPVLPNNNSLPSQPNPEPQMHQTNAQNHVQQNIFSQPPYAQYLHHQSNIRSPQLVHQQNRTNFYVQYSHLPKYLDLNKWGIRFDGSS